MEKLDKILQAIEFGKLIVKVQNGKIVSVPDQDIEQPEKIKEIAKIIKIKKPIEIDQ